MTTPTDQQSEARRRARIETEAWHRAMRLKTERGHKTEPNFYRRRNNDDRHADC